MDSRPGLFPVAAVFAGTGDGVLWRTDTEGLVRICGLLTAGEESGSGSLKELGALAFEDEVGCSIRAGVELDASKGSYPVSVFEDAYAAEVSGSLKSCAMSRGCGEAKKEKQLAPKKLSANLDRAGSPLTRTLRFDK